MPAPASGNRVTYDAEIPGFGVRVTAAGSKAFEFVNYRSGGRERRLTIGSYPAWTLVAAREEAKQLRRRIDRGEDPMGKRHEERAAPTLNDLADRFEAEHLAKRREATGRDYRSILRLHIRPRLGKMRVAHLRHVDIERLHNDLVQTAPYRANRTVAVLSKMLSLLRSSGRCEPTTQPWASSARRRRSASGSSPRPRLHASPTPSPLTLRRPPRTRFG